MPETKKTMWEELCKPFPKEAVGKLPKPYKKDSPKGRCSECGGYHGLPAVHLDYVGHAAVTDRLNTAVGASRWYWEPLARDLQGAPALDKDGNLWIKLTILYGDGGELASRIGVGDGNNMKERIGDAIRNAAMRFGVALDLWTKEELESHIDHPEEKNYKPSKEGVDAPAPEEPSEKTLLIEEMTSLLKKHGYDEDESARKTLYIATIEKERPTTIKDIRAIVAALKGL